MTMSNDLTSSTGYQDLHHVHTYATKHGLTYIVLDEGSKIVTEIHNHIGKEFPSTAPNHYIIINPVTFTMDSELFKYSSIITISKCPYCNRMVRPDPNADSDEDKDKEQIDQEKTFDGDSDNEYYCVRCDEWFSEDAIHKYDYHPYESDNVQITFHVQTAVGRSFIAGNRQVRTSSTTYYVLYAKSQKLINLFITYVKEKYYVPPESPSRYIYEWSDNSQCWYIPNSKPKCPEVLQTDLTGLDDYFALIDSDIKAMENDRVMLKRLGLTSGYNYLLYGNPGCGKSSFVKALATKLGVPIYNASLNKISPGNYQIAFTPRTSNINVYIVLLEDFDRTMDPRAVSEMLNALDGVMEANGIVLRFFTVNFPEAVEENNAMITRMRRKFEFEVLPSIGIAAHFKKIFTNRPSEIALLDEFAAKLDRVIPGQPMRTITHYISRFLGSPSIIQAAIDNMEKWAEEMKPKSSKD